MLLIKLRLTALEIRVFSFYSGYKQQMLMVMAKSCLEGLRGLCSVLMAATLLSQCSNQEQAGVT